MPIFQFTVEHRDGEMYSYYANCKNVSSYIRNIRSKWKNKYSKLYENANPQMTIYSIIGEKYGKYEYREIGFCLQDEDGVCDSFDDKRNLQFFINIDRNCINKYTHEFDKIKYNNKYRTKKKCGI
jgi:hypothetical protein